MEPRFHVTEIVFHFRMEFLGPQRDIKQEVVDIPIESTHYKELHELKDIDDGLLISYITHQCICCKGEIERFIFDRHMLEVHKVQMFLEGIKVRHSCIVKRYRVFSLIGNGLIGNKKYFIPSNRKQPFPGK